VGYGRVGLGWVSLGKVWLSDVRLVKVIFCGMVQVLTWWNKIWPG
jgi:hypothetical protein